MNAKTAKLVRRVVKSLGNNPRDARYHREGGNFSPKSIRPLVLDADCGRAVYKRTKARY